MDTPTRTRPPSKKSPATSPATSSSAPLSTVPSPDLLHVIDALKAEIAELRAAPGGMTADEKAELAQLKQDLADAKAELAASNPSRRDRHVTDAPERRRINYGLFAVEVC